MSSSEARTAWDELVAIERNHPFLAGTGASSTATRAAKPVRAPVASQKIISDQTWGFVEVSSHDLNILDSDYVQRLRGVAAIPMANMVYPGLVHSRFDHTLGCLALVTRILETLFSDTPVRRSLEREMDCSIEGIKAVARVAALVKDVAHVPFSEMRSAAPQVLVNDDSANDTQVQVRRRILHSPKFAPAIEQCLAGIPASSKVGFLSSFLEGNELRWKWLLELLDGPLSADRINLVSRAGHFAAIQVAFDAVRIGRMFEVRRKSVDDHALSLCLREKGEHRIEDFLIADYLFHQRIALHKEVRSFRLHWDSACSSLHLDLTKPDIVAQLTDAKLMERIRSHAPAQVDVTALMERRCFSSFYLRQSVVSPDELTHLVGDILHTISAEETECRVRYVPWAQSRKDVFGRLLARYDDLKKYLLSSISVLSRKKLSDETIKATELKLRKAG